MRKADASSSFGGFDSSLYLADSTAPLFASFWVADCENVASVFPGTPYRLDTLSLS